MVLTNKYSQALIEKFPDFAASEILKETIELFEDNGRVNARTVFVGLTNYVVNGLAKNNKDITQEEIDIYLFVEELRNSYSNYSEDTEEREFDQAACSCFLENLLNRASSGDIKYSRFIPYLGDKSKEFCRAWDEFTGVKTDGLWDN